MLFSILWVYSSSGVCDLKNQTRRYCLLEVELLTQHNPHNQHCLLPENDIFWATQASSPDSIVFPVRDRRHGASSQVLRDEHFCNKSSCNVAFHDFHALSMKEKQKRKKHSGNECVVFEIEAYTNFKFQLRMWNTGIVVTRQILEICLFFAICIQQTVFGCSSTPGHTRLDLHQTRLRGQSADIQRRLQAMDVWGGSKIKTS